jgi:uncharacterized repeat protein (TIGR01451 family)
MNNSTHHPVIKGLWLGLAILGGVFLLATVLLMVSISPLTVHADPIDPPEGYPKLSLSVKTVTPTLAATGGVTLYYTIEIYNTGAYTAENVILTDHIDEHTAFTGEMGASASPTPTIVSDTLTWTGTVGFDETVVVTFNVTVDAAFSGTVVNTAFISQPLISAIVAKTAETVVTDHPILEIEKTSSPAKPGHNVPLVYTLVVANRGQSRAGLPITVTDYVPSGTALYRVGMDGVTGTIGSDLVLTWTRHVTLALNQTTAFTFSVMVDESVSPGDVLTNAVYAVDSDETDAVYGEPYTVTVHAPEFRLSKHVWPDPPGSNREMTYTLGLFNMGALALDMVITDVVPPGVSYVRGGDHSNGVVSWTLESLDTGESAHFTYTVYISDVMDIPIVNDNYGVCDGAGLCQPGKALTSVVQGPVFETAAIVDPIAHKPGGGVGTDVWPTLIARNLGPGNAIAAQATLLFDRISVQLNDISVDPSVGNLTSGPACGENCVSYIWIGDLGVGDVVTFATTDGQNTIGGDEGTPYTATIIITDALGTRNTDPVSDTAVGLVTHYANLNLRKTAPSVIGCGQIITYTIDIWNSALSTEQPPYPYLLDLLPENVTLITGSISHGGTYTTVSGTLGLMTAISWTLPGLGTGEALLEPRTFAVRVDDDLVSGTQIVNRWYSTHWYESEESRYFSNTGEPLTTTVKEVGLIDSHKEVRPKLALPGSDNVLTYTLHIVNSSPLPLSGVMVYDYLPWQSSTYQRNAVTSAGDVVSDIVSIQWTGDVAPLSSEVITFTVLVDPDYQGAITNTAVISHPELANAVQVEAVAYITEKPVLQITKSASPNPVDPGTELAYTIRVVNRGQQATTLVITDTIPANTEIVTASITAGGELDEANGQIRWESDFLAPGKSHTFGFNVTVGGGYRVVNGYYIVRCAEGVVAEGEPVITRIVGGGAIYLPLVLRNAP